MADLSSDPLSEDYGHQDGAIEGHHDKDFSRKQSNARAGDVDEDEGGDEEEEEEEGGEEDDDDDDDDDEDEEEEGPIRKRRKKSKRFANRYLDTEAVVDNDDEDFDDDDDEALKETQDFIEADDPSLETPDGRRRILADHQRLDRQHEAILEEDAEAMARRLKERYARPASRYVGDNDQVPQRLLMPSVNDASLWQVRVKPGREKDIVISLMRKFLDKEYSGGQSLSILSAFYRDSLPGMIYVEARNEKQVNQAVSGLVGVYPSRGYILVPIDEMASLLKIKKQVTTITPGSWVRIKRGKYAGDLARVIDVTDNGEEAGLMFIPRIDLTPRENESLKRKKGTSTIQGSATARPPQRLFNLEEVIKVYGKHSVSARDKGEIVFHGDTYRNGFLEKDIKIHGIITENVNPTLDEVAAFQAAENLERSYDSRLAALPPVDLSVIANAARKAATSVLQPGDHVEVFEGEQVGVDGIVENIRDDVVILRPKVLDMEDHKIEVSAASVRKRFKPGDHVKVMAGKSADETGLVVAVDGDVVSIWSDVSHQEVNVFSKDVREAAEVGSGTNAVGAYELHNLVQLDQQTVGVIFKTERVSFRVLDQHGAIRHVQPHQITMRRDSSRAVATDADGHPIRMGDNLKEIEGEHRRGTVLHIHQSQFVFLFNRDIPEHNGVFVARCRAVASAAPKGISNGRPVMDLSSMNPAVGGGVLGGVVGSGTMGRGPRDRLIGIQITVVKGEYKGYMGTVKDTNGNMARVELLTNNRVISIDKAKLRRKNPNNGALEELDQSFNSHSSFQMPPPANFGARASPWAGSGTRGDATPNPYLSPNGGRTPGQGLTGRTPNPYTGGGRTPGWNQGVTPNPYVSGTRTPAWNSATPNPYISGSGSGGRTPGWNNAATPNPYLSGSKTPSHNSSSTAGTWGDSPSPTWQGNKSPAGPNWGNASPVYGNQAAASAPTPFAATTPYSAPTPYAAGTPYSAPTPGSGLYGDGSTPASHTPGTGFGGYATTPAAAATPFTFGASSSSSHTGLSEDWLTKAGPLLEPNRIKLRVKIDSKGAWRDGQFDGKDVAVISVKEMDQWSEIETSALVELDEGQFTVPGRYIVPRHPDAANHHALALHGTFMNKVIKILHVDEDLCMAIAARESMFGKTEGYNAKELILSELID